MGYGVFLGAEVHRPERLEVRREGLRLPEALARARRIFDRGAPVGDELVDHGVQRGVLRGQRPDGRAHVGRQREPREAGDDGLVLVRAVLRQRDREVPQELTRGPSDLLGRRARRRGEPLPELREVPDPLVAFEEQVDRIPGGVALGAPAYGNKHRERPPNRGSPRGAGPERDAEVHELHAVLLAVHRLVGAEGRTGLHGEVAARAVVAEEHAAHRGGPPRAHDARADAARGLETETRDRA
jgi:hypothetical protein